MTDSSAEPGSEPGLVVVGAGLAAANVVTTIREAGDSRPITLVGDEGERPYERPALSKEVLLGKAEADSVYVHDEQWYADQRVDTHLDDAAVGFDPVNRTVRLQSGESLHYADLVLATGARPRMLPLDGIGLAGVHTLRRIADSLALRSAFTEGTRVVVIGAGWIGLEVAAAARQSGADVTVLEYAEVPLRAAMGDQLGSYFADLHRRNGVDLRLGIGVEGIEGDGSVTGVRAGGEVFPADLVVVGVGAVPNTELAEHAGLAVDNGIVVDAQLRAQEGVYAVGDVANAFNTALDTRLRVEHWDNAIKQGKLAGRVLLGEEASYDWLPYFYTDQFDLGMEYVGRGSADDDVVIRGSLDSGEFIAFWLRDGVVTAGMNVNVWDVNKDLRALVGSRVAPQRLADESVALADLR
ncbi:MAG TPA: FAD-dependent oxidoreductase [Marmoricola sp.]|jgi:3-phenylpropionate/trans-cinnamate dioxygenase ferredoxin reductase subunit|nr:FAD-dependent oxidoreductase [Marmoricola sp.]